MVQRYRDARYMKYHHSVLFLRIFNCCWHYNWGYYAQASEEAMAPHSSALAWKTPGTGEPGGLQSMRSLRVRHDWATSLPLSRIGEGNGNPLQCSCLENPGDGGAWWAAVSGITQSRTRLKRLSSSTHRHAIDGSPNSTSVSLVAQW